MQVLRTRAAAAIGSRTSGSSRVRELSQRDMRSSAKVGRCARRVLKPLIHVLVAAGLSEQELTRICTQVVQGLPARVRARRLASLPADGRLEQLIARWTTDPTYLDGGAPMLLRLRGRRPTFATLAKAVSSKSSPADTLRLLGKRGLVQINRKGQVRLLARFYPVRDVDAFDLELFTTMTIDFLRTHEFNFLRNPRRGHGLFQRMAHKRDSDARIAQQFNRYIRERGQQFLEAMDDWLYRHRPRRTGRSRKKVRLGVGMYVINESLR